MTRATAARIAHARELLAAGDLAAAEVELAHAARELPGAPDVHYLRGVVANRRGDHAAALAFLQQALAIAPEMILGWLALGHAYMRGDRFGLAAEAYAQAARLDPGAADAHYNLGIAHRRLEDLAAAAADFHRAWRRDPLLTNAGKACVATVALLVKAARSGPVEHSIAAPGPGPGQGAAQASSIAPGVSADGATAGRAAPPTALPVPRGPMARPARPASISVVVCSIDDTKATRVRMLYETLLRGVPHDIQVLRDARSLAEAYNRGIASSTNEIVVLSHDDIDILAPDFAARVLHHLEGADVLGIVGATRMTGPIPIWSGHPHARGWITHHTPGEAEWQVDVADWRPLAGGVQVLDGVLLVARRSVLEHVAFDAATFDGFHGYDVDWSHRAARAGYHLACAGDLRVVHASRGRYGADWQRYAERLCAKHALPAPDPAPVPFHSARLASTSEVGDFFDRMMDLAAADPP